MIDVIFCILTFFILAAVGFSRQQAISVDIPKARTGTPQGQEILMITLDQSGEVYVEKERMLRKEQFKRKLEAYRQQNPGGLMALYASENARYNQVVQVLDFLREVGGERVALATLAGELPTSNQPATQPPGTSVPGLDPNQQPGTSIPGITPPTPGTSIPGITPPTSGTSIPGITPPTPGTSIPGITPPTSGTSIPGITPPTSGTYPNQQPQGLPNFNGSSPGNQQPQGSPNLNSPSPGNLQQSLPGDTGVSPNPRPTASPRKSNTLPES